MERTRLPASVVRASHSIFGKLGVRDRAAAIVFAYDHDVITPGVTVE